jgi:hypothetical protein
MKYSIISDNSKYLNTLTVFRYAFFVLLLLAILVFSNACCDGDRPEINGMWQLKTIQDENRNSQIQDTIFYSFQRQSIFSYTQLHEKEGQPSRSTIVYGYIDFPDNNHLHILLDKIHKQYDLLPWNWGKEFPSNDVTYDLIKLDSKKLILFHDGKTYNFIKY